MGLGGGGALVTGTGAGAGFGAGAVDGGNGGKAMIGSLVVGPAAAGGGALSSGLTSAAGGASESGISGVFSAGVSGPAAGTSVPSESARRAPEMRPASFRAVTVPDATLLF